MVVKPNVTAALYLYDLSLYFSFLFLIIIFEMTFIGFVLCWKLNKKKRFTNKDNQFISSDRREIYSLVVCVWVYTAIKGKSKLIYTEKAYAPKIFTILVHFFVLLLFPKREKKTQLIGSCLLIRKQNEKKNSPKWKTQKKKKNFKFTINITSTKEEEEEKISSWLFYF